MKLLTIHNSFLSLSALLIQSGSAEPIPPPTAHTSVAASASVHATSHRAGAASSAETVLMKHSDGPILLKHRKPTLLCIDGFHLNLSNGRCEKMDTVDASVGCPNGWDLKESECETSFVDSAELGCPVGFERASSGCVREYDAPMNLLCPPHYLASAEGCIKDVETSPTWTCEEGELNGDTCETIKLTMQMITCPAGFDRVDDSDKCSRVRDERPVLQCPLDYELRDKQCHKLLSLAATKRCPDGNITEDGACIATTVFPMPSHCPLNTTEHNHMCRKSRTQDAAIICPPGSEDAGPVCLTEEIQPVTFVCPGGLARPGRDGVCPGKEPPVKQCPGGWTFKNKSQCVKKSVIPKIVKCPLGMNVLGDHCAADEYIDPVKSCPPGTRQVDDYSCTMEARKEVVLVCEAPYVLVESTGECLFSSVIAATPDCIEGFYDEARGHCTIAEVLAAEVGCPHGAVKIRSGSRSVCREVLYEKAKPSCPVDFVLKDGDQCRGQAIIAGKLACDSPFVERDGKCVIVERRMIEPHCTDGVLKGSSCITTRKQPPAILCPETYVYSPGSRMCKKFLWSEPNIECHGWAYDRRVKECYIYQGSEEWDAEVAAKAKNSGNGTPSGNGGPSSSQPFGPASPPSGSPQLSPSGSDTTPTKKPNESLLPLEVRATTTTTRATTTGTVKARVQQPAQGKENFVPMQTFTGANAVAQAQQYEMLKLQGNHAQPVLAPQIHTTTSF